MVLSMTWNPVLHKLTSMNLELVPVIYNFEVASTLLSCCPDLQFLKGLNITADQKKFFRKANQTYYDSAVELLLSEHAVRTLELSFW